MKHIILALVMFLVVGCSPTLKSSSGIPIKAIYLVQGVGQLSQEDLQAHPEVMVTDKFDDFKKLAESKVALWIDINSVGLVDIGWLGESPQRYYPVVLIGNSKDFCIFFGNMQYFTFEVPAPAPGEEDYCNTPIPGFSVNMLKSESGGNMHGYEETPTAQGILDVTNHLLEEAK
jgi:hypothetical protein